MAEIKKRRQSHEARAKKARSTSAEKEVRRRTSRQRAQSDPRHQALISAGDRESELENPEIPSISKVFNSMLQKLSLKALKCSAQVTTAESTGPVPMQNKDPARNEEHAHDSLIVMTSQTTYNPSILKSLRQSPTGETQKQSDQEMRPQMENHYFCADAKHKEADVNGDRKSTTDEQMARRRSSTPMPNTSKTKSKRQANDSHGKSKSKSKSKSRKSGQQKKREKPKTAIRPTESPRHGEETTKRVDNEISSFINSALDVDVETKLPLIEDSSPKHEKKKVSKTEKSKSKKTEKKQKSRHTPKEKKTKSKKLPVIQKLPFALDLKPQEEVDLSKPGAETNGTLKGDEEMSSFITSSLDENDLDLSSTDIPLFDSQQQFIKNLHTEVKKKVVHKEKKRSVWNKPEKLRTRHTSQNSRTLKENRRIFSSTTNEHIKSASASLQACRHPAEIDDEAIATTATRYPVNKSIQLFVASQIELPNIKPRPKALHGSQTDTEADVVDMNCQNSAKRHRKSSIQECALSPAAIFGMSRCNSLNPEEMASMIEKEGGEVIHTIEEYVIQVPPFFPKDHNLTRRMLEFLKDTPRSELLPRMEAAPYLFHSAYFQLPDRQSGGALTAFNRRVILYLNAQGICAYFGYTKMLSFLVSSHSTGDCCIKASEPCFISGVQDTSTFGDIEVVNAACLAMRRGNGPILAEFMKRGWSIHNSVRIFYRRLFTDHDYLYEDGIDYLLEVTYNKPGHNLTSIFKTLIYEKRTNFQIHSYRIIARDLEFYQCIKDNISIPRRLLHHITSEQCLNNGFNVLSSIMLFADQRFFEGSEVWNTEVQVSEQRLSELIRGMTEDDQECTWTFDQDCCLALCLGILQEARDLGHKAKSGIRDLLMHLTLRILLQTRWIVEITAYRVDILTTYFNSLEEAIVIESDTIKFLQQKLPEFIRIHQHSITKDINCFKVFNGIKELHPEFDVPSHYKISVR